MPSIIGSIPTLPHSSDYHKDERPREFNDQDSETIRIRIMRMVEEWYSRYGRPPTQKEMYTIGGIHSFKRINEAIDRLVAEGYLVRVKDGRYNRLRLTKKRMFI